MSPHHSGAELLSPPQRNHCTGQKLVRAQAAARDNIENIQCDIRQKITSLELCKNEVCILISPLPP